MKRLIHMGLIAALAFAAALPSAAQEKKDEVTEASVRKEWNDWGFKVCRYVMKKRSGENVVLSPVGFNPTTAALWQGGDKDVQTEFEKAAALRDELIELRKQIGGNESLLFQGKAPKIFDSALKELVGN